MGNDFTPFAHPLYIMTKAAGSSCNLACKYCYYLEKNNLYKEIQADNRFVLTDELLEKFIRMYIESQTTPQIQFCWHGGESLMRPISFYKKVVELQKKYSQGRIIDNALQTNGTLLNDEWCRFFKDNNWLVGVSIDGPQEFHDEYRKTKAGAPSFRKVMHGIELLRKHGVEWNALAVAMISMAIILLSSIISLKRWSADISNSLPLWSVSSHARMVAILLLRWITRMFR